MTDLVGAGSALLLLAIAGTLLEGVRRGNVSVTVNSLAMLAVALVPTAVQWTVVPTLQGGTALTVWIAAAGLLHSLGMLGLYETQWWWDHLTHAVSAALVAALADAAARVALADPAVVAAVTLGMTMVAGAFWELLELLARELGRRFDVEPLLIHYGWRDTGYDLVFDLAGGLLVVGLDLRVFVPLAGRYPDAAGTLLTWAGGVLVGASLVLGGTLWAVGAVPSLR